MNIEIANRLQKLRKENGYSQEELADKLGISRQAVSKWERAESSPDTDNLIVLARLYNISLDELLNDSESDEEIRDRVIDREQEEKKDSSSMVFTDDEGQTLKIENGHMHCYNKDGSEHKVDKKQMIFVSTMDGVVALLTLIGFLVWGMCFDGTYIIVSDGTEYLYFYEPQDFTLHHKVSVFDNLGAVSRLNELEFVQGFVYANIYTTDKIVKINPKNGKVAAEIDFTNLLPDQYRTENIDVLNGIAWNQDSDHFYVTGKLWPRLFEVRLFYKEK